MAANSHGSNGVPMIVRSEIVNANSPVTTVHQLAPGDHSGQCVMRDKPGGRVARGHRSLGDLQELIKYKVNKDTQQKKPTRKSDGKEYKIVRREYIY